MTEHVPLYRWSIEDAVHQGELDCWLQSYTENCTCARAIEETLDEVYEGAPLQDDSVQAILKRFGFDRTIRVLACTLREGRSETGYSRENVYWAARGYLPKDNLQRDYCVDHEPALVNAFTNRVRKALQDLGLFDSSHCEPEQDGQLDYEGKVLVLKSHVLKDQYKTPDNQLFFAESGFGCAPNARGRKVYGRFLKDGEETHFNRQEFIGILKDEHLPEWAVEKLRELYPPEEEDSGMTMQ